MSTHLRSLDEVARLARTIVEEVVWCTVSTVSAVGEPRNRLMHPVWYWDGDAPAALVTARPTPLKVGHLAGNPNVSCLYWDPSHHTVVIDGTASWVEPHGRASAWEAIKAVDPPVGFDPAMIWPEGPDSVDCGILRLVAHRIIATRPGEPGLRWNGGPPDDD